MKVLAWILAVAMIPVGLFASVIFYVSFSLGLSAGSVGGVLCLVGILSAVICIVGSVLGIKQLRRGNVKKAFAWILAGAVFIGIISAGLGICDVLNTKRVANIVAAEQAQLYGENWDAPPAMEGIPENCVELMNQYYAIIKNEWPAEELNVVNSVAMADYYGDAPLDNIGFCFKDLNGDGINELIIGTAAPTAEGGTAFFCIYYGAGDLSYTLDSEAGETYYLHDGESEGTYVAELAGQELAWVIEPVTDGDGYLEITEREGAMDPAGRLTLEMIPFSQYK